MSKKSKSEMVKRYMKGNEKAEQKRNIQKATKHQKRNRSERDPRRRDWFDLEDEEAAVYTFERIMPLDESERQQTVAKKIQYDLPTQAADEPITDGTFGRVIEVSSGISRVNVEGQEVLCTLRGSLTADETGFTNVIAVGDEVLLTLTDDERGVIDQVLPRRNKIARPDPGTKQFQQLLVANVDQVLIVSAWRNPQVWTELIDRYIITAERNDITPIICLNKVDLADDLEAVQAFMQPYQDLGYTILYTSAEQNIGIDETRDWLHGKISVVAGLSGVGKSSLLSAVQPGFELKVGEVNAERGQGRHTTTQSNMLPFGEDGFVIDTAGIREFGLIGLSKDDLLEFYPEFAHQGCRFADCKHLEEPDCAVRDSVADGTISEMRYHNYRQILETLS